MAARRLLSFSFGHRGTSIVEENMCRGRLLYGLVLFTLGTGVTLAQDAPRLPTGLAPVQVIARMTGKSSVTLVIPYHEFVREEVNDGMGSVRIVPVLREESRSVSLKEVKVVRADGKEVDVKQLPELLVRPLPALCSADGKVVDPLHLRLVKDGTLIFVGPTPKVVPFTTVP